VNKSVSVCSRLVVAQLDVLLVRV